MHSSHSSAPTIAPHRRLAFWLAASLVLALTTGALVQRSEAQQYSWSTFAGAAGVAGSADTPGFFNQPYHLARDISGNVYATDYASHTVRKITPGGVVSTFAGAAGQAGAVNATGTAARFNGPGTIIADAAGTLYVCDFNSNTIRQITSAGVVTTLAGTAGVAGSADGVGAAARFNSPQGLALDGLGNLYVSDALNHTIRKIVIATAAVSTFAGQAGSSGSTDGTGTAARFFVPIALVLDGGGNLVVSDGLNYTLRRVTPAGVVTTIAGFPGSPGTVDGVGSAARLNSPYDLVLDGTSSTIFFSEFNSNTVRRITADGTVSTLCGLAGTSGYANGTGSNARFNQPAGIVVDGTSNTLLVSEVGNKTIRRVSYDGVCTTWAGTPGVAGSADTAGVFRSPAGIARDSSGNFFVVDRGSHVIRKITPAGVLSTFAGQAGVTGSADATGGAARFFFPAGMAIDAANNLYVADNSNHTIRMITPAGVVTTLAGQAGVSGTADGTGSAARFQFPEWLAVDTAGTFLLVTDVNFGVRKVIISSRAVSTFAGGSPGSADGTGTAARFSVLTGVALDAAGNAYVADTRSIRKITPSAVVTTLAGKSGIYGSIDGTGSAAQFSNLRGVAIDSGGNLLVADTGNSTLRKVTPAGVVTTLAGLPGSSGHTDGVGSAARFSGLDGLTLDALGNIFVTSTNAATIRKVTPGGAVTTFAGTPNLSATTDTGGNFNLPYGTAVDATGNVYVADSNNHTLRKITPAGVISTLAGTAGQSGSTDATGAAARFYIPRGLAVDGSGNIYVADGGNNTIRRVTPAGVVTTIAGAAGISGSTDGVGGAARFDTPVGICIDVAGANLFVADGANHTIRQIVIATNTVSTFAGLAGAIGSADGGAAARFNFPAGVAADAAGNIYVADGINSTIRKITSAGLVSTLAGLAGVNGGADGTGAAARFTNPTHLAADAAGNVYVTDQPLHAIRKVSPAGVVTTIGGLMGVSGTTDGTGASARFNQPAGIALDASGNLFVGDVVNQTIRKGRPLTAKARMTSPALGAALPAPTTVFEWEPGTGATQYALWIGRTPGGYDLYAGAEGTNLSKTVSLPPDTKVYVTLYSLIGGAWQGNSYAYEPAPSAKAALVSPTVGSTLTSGVLNLQWSAGTGCSAYAIWVGNAPGGYDLGAGGYSPGTNTATFTGIPTDGGPVYVRLYSLINGVYQFNDYWFTTQTGAGNRPARLTNPTPNGNTIGNGAVTFVWDAGAGTTSHVIYIGSTPGGYDILASATGTGTIVIPTNIPGDGRKIYVTLYSLIGGAYQSNSYFFNCSNSAAPSAISSPASGSTLGTSQLFHWNGMAGATNYVLYVGSTPGGYDLYAGSEGLVTSKTVNGLPADGRVVHVTLWSLIDGTYKSSASWFYAAPDPQSVASIRIASPTNGQFLPDASTTFTFGGGGGYNANHYPFQLGSTPGGYDLYSAIETSNTRTVTLPTDGRKIYATLFSLIGGVYKSNSYLFTAPQITPVKAVLTSPANGSTFTSSSATFNWTTGTGATRYYLFIGSTPGAYDLYIGDQGTATTRTVTGLPTDGRPIHVTLHSLINGAYQASTYVFNAWQAP